MNRLFLRIVAVLLVFCITAEPAIGQFRAQNSGLRESISELSVLTSELLTTQALAPVSGVVPGPFEAPKALAKDVTTEFEKIKDQGTAGSEESFPGATIAVRLRIGFEAVGFTLLVFLAPKFLLHHPSPMNLWAALAVIAVDQSTKWVAERHWKRTVDGKNIHWIGPIAFMNVFHHPSTFRGAILLWSLLVIPQIAARPIPGLNPILLGLLVGGAFANILEWNQRRGSTDWLAVRIPGPHIQSAWARGLLREKEIWAVLNFADLANTAGVAAYIYHSRPTFRNLAGDLLILMLLRWLAQQWRRWRLKTTSQTSPAAPPRSFGGKRESMSFSAQEPDLFRQLDPRALENHYRDRFEGLKMTNGPARGGGTGKEKSASRKSVKQSPKIIQRYVDYYLVAAHRAQERSHLHVVTLSGFTEESELQPADAIKALLYLLNNQWLGRVPPTPLTSQQFRLTDKALARLALLLKTPKRSAAAPKKTVKGKLNGRDSLGLLNEENHAEIQRTIKEFIAKNFSTLRDVADSLKISESVFRRYFDIKFISATELVSLLKFCMKIDPETFQPLLEKIIIKIRALALRVIKIKKVPIFEFVGTLGSSDPSGIQSFLSKKANELSDSNYRLLARRLGFAHRVHKLGKAGRSA